MAWRTGRPPQSDARPPTATARLTWAPSLSRRASLHGAWWPRSNEPLDELPGLVEDVDAQRGGAAMCIMLAPDGWEDRSPRLRVAGRLVRVGWFTTQPVNLLTATFAEYPNLHLLVIPPETEPALAEAAMVMAAAPGNAVAANDILATVASDFAASGRMGETDSAVPES